MSSGEGVLKFDIALFCLALIILSVLRGSVMDKEADIHKTYEAGPRASQKQGGLATYRQSLV